MVEQGKVTGFRLPDVTLEELDKLQEMEVIRHRTDGVIRATHRYYLEESYNNNPFLKIISCIIHSERVLENWDLLEEGRQIVLIREDSGEEDILIKKGNCQAEISKRIDGKKVKITVSCE